jgi:hypothetical protein
MSPETSRINVTKEIVVVSLIKPVGFDYKPLSGGIHFHLSLLPICLGYGEFRALVRLNLVNNVVLTVKINSEPYTVFPDLLYSYLTVTSFDAKVVKYLVLICRPRRRVLILKIVLT